MNGLMQNYMGFDGRINRQRWWIGVIVLAIVGIILSWILSMIFGTGLIIDMSTLSDQAALNSYVQRVGWVGVISSVLLAYPYMALTVKRRHDRGNNGYDAMALIALEVIVNLLNALGIGIGTLSSILGFIVGIFALYMLVVAGFLKGTTGPNEYGPDPLQG